MAWIIAKYFITAGVLVSELAKRSDKLGAFVAALPLVTLLTLIWLYVENQPQEKVANHAWYTFWYVVPTLPMFLVFPALEPRNQTRTSMNTVLKKLLILASVCCLCASASASASATATASNWQANAVHSGKNNFDVAKLRKEAEQGDAHAQYNLGVSYENGLDVPQDYSQALTWLRKSAEQGYAPGQNGLATLYSYGRGVTRDDKQSVVWYRKAAEQGYERAQYNLGAAYFNGLGVAKDYRQAALWTEKSAEQGNIYAMYNLALSYSRGQGVEKDLVQSHKWFSLAAASGDKPAAKKRDELETQMTPEQIRQAQALAKEWKPRCK